MQRAQHRDTLSCCRLTLSSAAPPLGGGGGWNDDFTLRQGSNGGVAAGDRARSGVRWQLLHGGGAAALAALLSSPHRVPLPRRR